MNTLSPVMKLLVAAGAVYAAYHFGGSVVKTLALGAAGYMVLNNIPVLQDGLQTRLVQAAA